MKIRFVAATAVALVLASTANAEGTIKNGVIDIYTGFDEAGNINPARPLTATEAIMVANIDKHCAELSKSLEGELKLYLKSAAKMGFWQGLGLVLGKFLGGMTGLSALNALGYGGGAGVGAGVGAMTLTVPQIVGSFDAYCKIQWIAANRNDPDDRRLKNVMFFPAGQLQGKLPAVDTTKITPMGGNGEPAPASEAEIPPQ